MNKVCCIVGIRPQYIKMSKLMKLLKSDRRFKIIIINTGQHYDYKLSQQFFKQLKIPNADYNLGVGSGSHAEQTAKMMIGIEKILIKEKPDMTVVIGDGNTTLAGAITSRKLHIPIAHIEAGLRSDNWQMPEEINRVLTDHCASVLFAPTKNAYDKLIKEGLSKNTIYLTGDVTLDILNENMKQINKSDIMKRIGVSKKKFILMTLHRAENTDNETNLKNILSSLSSFDNVVFPIHPRTKKMISEFKLDNICKSIKIIEPLGYFDFAKLLKEASVFVTDSGGATKESFLLKTPSVIIRNETEWIEPVNLSASIVAGTSPARIRSSIKKMIRKHVTYTKNPFGDGKATEKTIKIISKLISSKHLL